MNRSIDWPKASPGAPVRPAGRPLALALGPEAREGRESPLFGARPRAGQTFQVVRGRAINQVLVLLLGGLGRRWPTKCGFGPELGPNINTTTTLSRPSLGPNSRKSASAAAAAREQRPTTTNWSLEAQPPGAKWMQIGARQHFCSNWLGRRRNKFPRGRNKCDYYLLPARPLARWDGGRPPIDMGPPVAQPPIGRRSRGNAPNDQLFPRNGRRRSREQTASGRDHFHQPLAGWRRVNAN